MIDHSTLQPGQRLSYEILTLDADSIAAYVDAVSDSSLPASADGVPLAPPMAIAARALSAVINALQIPGGTIHAGQELEFGKAMPVGATLACNATLAQNSTRRGWRFLVVNLTAADDGGNTVMSGKSTIMLPE